VKVYQCIHKYKPHIPLFEKKYGIRDDLQISFEDLRRLVIEDGYASSYIIQPALEYKTEKVFFTIWDYERLQHLWAKENGLETKDLSEIKLAQLKAFSPDVFYNMSPFCDDNFIELVKIAGIKCKTISWNGIIEPRPRTFPLYDAHLTLHKPYVSYWKQLGLKAFELQPGIPINWTYDNEERQIDVLFYGQYFEGMFTDRNRLIDSLLEFKRKSKYRINIHLQYKLRKSILFKIPKFGISRTIYPKKNVRNFSAAPLYGKELYTTISKSKVIVNAYTNDNMDFKSNMRVFEAIGHGAFLISERGNYPEGLEPDIDFYTYEGFDELKEKIEFVLLNWDEHQKKALNAAEKIRFIFSKENQWKRFQEIVAEL
jgi:hypothetical protein